MTDRYKLLLVALAVSNLVIGIAAFYAVITIDQRYSQLLDSGLTTLNRARTLAWTDLKIKRAANRFDSTPADERPRLLAMATRSAQESDRLIREFIGSPLVQEQAGVPDDLMRLHEEYRRVADLWTEAATSRNIALANKIHVEVLRPAYDRYVEELSRAIDRVERDGQNANSALSDKSQGVGRLLLLVASWPLWLAMVGILSAVLALASVVGWITFSGDEKD